LSAEESCGKHAAMLHGGKYESKKRVVAEFFLTQNIMHIAANPSQFMQFAHTTLH
jgi:hypothetical protein